MFRTHFLFLVSAIVPIGIVNAAPVTVDVFAGAVAVSISQTTDPTKPGKLAFHAESQLLRFVFGSMSLQVAENPAFGFAKITTVLHFQNTYLPQSTNNSFFEKKVDVLGDSALRANTYSFNRFDGVLFQAVNGEVDFVSGELGLTTWAQGSDGRGDIKYTAISYLSSEPQTFTQPLPITLSFAPVVPEPSSLGVVGLMIACLLSRRRSSTF